MPTPPPFDPPATFNLADHLLARRLEEGRGGRTALITDAGSWTYREVHELASRFGHALLDAGVRPEERVLVALPDGADFVGALFGALRMGAVVVMVNPDQKPDGLAHVFGYTRARAVVVGLGHLEGFQAAARQAPWAPRFLVVGEPSFDAALGGAPTELDAFPTHRDDAAIWLFSGGTTGRPKAVVQSHASFGNTTELYGKGVLGLGEDDRTLAVPKLYFGYATGSNLFFPFSVGASSILFPERCTAETLFGQIARHRPTLLVNVPTMINHMVGHPDAAAQDLSSLRLATSAGEALPVELHRRWDETWGVELLDGLGTAEMWHVFLSNRPGDVGRGTLGRVVPGFEVRLCDEDGREVPDGEPGVLR
ncbi:MAG: AMP-binding protein, partial [Gemmatimonadetes bacterium]|nr:AMP-binding protein [Gemmatimonadota bacterium]